jgi:excisionase family DNA binding protein
MKEVEQAVSYAIARTKSRELAELGPDELLLGALQAISRFGVAQLGAACIDLEELGLRWMEQVKPGGQKPGFSDSAVAIFDMAARIARADGTNVIGLDHLLAAFSNEETGLMATLKARYGITGASWRVGITQLSQASVAATTSLPGSVAIPEAQVTDPAKDYLSPDEAAEALGIHVQTLRGYVRSGKLPALRLAGERAIRIRRTDLAAVLEPLVPQSAALNF